MGGTLWEWNCMTCGQRLRIERHEDGPDGAYIEATHGAGEARLIVTKAEQDAARDSAYAGKRISVWLHEIHQYEGTGRTITITGRSEVA